jgi:hypothetical protein
MVVFCYRGEEELLPMTLKRAKEAIPNVHIHLFDDGQDPLREKTVKWLVDTLGCTYERTFFDRKVNLNGKECIVGELECMLKSMEADNNTDGYVIKMDPDTIILRFNLIQEAIDQGAKWVSHSSTKGHFAGMFYTMHRSILEVVYRNAVACEFPDSCAEDETIGSLCYIAAAQGIYSWTHTALPDGPRKFAAFPCETYGTDAYWGNIIWCAFAGHVLTLGNTGMFGLTKSWQVVNCRDLLWAFYNQDKAKAMCKNPERLDNLPELHLEVVNIVKNKEDFARRQAIDTTAAASPTSEKPVVI